MPREPSIVSNRSKRQSLRSCLKSYTMKYEPVIGLEVHAQLLTHSKIFCGCPTRFGEEPNQNTCPVCMGFPGVLPVLNKRVVEFAIRVGLATHCEISRYSRWARKNYFYPDLPKGYQISQYELPICSNGYIDIGAEAAQRRIRLTRIHMEEDAGKNIHDVRGDYSLVDLNRAGVPLIEIVSEPDIKSPEEAGRYLRSLRSILQYLEVCDGNMEEGSFRCDANVSVRPTGSSVLGVKAELKNMNSFKAVEKALEYEIKRQMETLSDGGTLIQETRLWDADREVSRSLRSKEYAHDYRYFPDPDLLPLVIDNEWIENIRASLPEMPDERRARFISEYDIRAYDAELLTGRKDVADYFEEAVRLHANPKGISNWVVGDLFRVIKEERLDEKLRISNWPLSPAHLAAMVRMIDEGKISGKMAKGLFEEMLATGQPPDKIVREKGLEQVKDTGSIEQAVAQVISNHSQQVSDYRSGKEKVFGFLVGQVMKATHGKANPQMVNEILKRKLES
ncbi:MAG: Asp-tRNA(Asn)/Glu-tRNA(Gln) amidotransferase subunit GatB [Deltaproteobacteria bacterium]|nr:Asp-tRNA(Asn)/Glu-tRNA(Gln) amidotransferase subunit GatB [Deltaproteobacteria bacterium]